MNRQKQPRLLVSACLCGHPCRYDGGQFDIPALQALEASGEAVAFCPECAGGLPTPRIPCEICGDRVISREGQDCTAAYRRGAEAALAMCRRHSQGRQSQLRCHPHLRWLPHRPVHPRPGHHRRTAGGKRHCPVYRRKLDGSFFVGNRPQGLTLEGGKTGQTTHP